MNAKTFSAALGEVDGKYVTEAIIYRGTTKNETSVYFRKRIVLAAAIIAALLLTGFAAYQAGLFDPWLQKPSASPVETVQSALEGQLEKEYTITVKIGEIEVDENATERTKSVYHGSDLAKANGWSDEYIQNNMVVVHAEYYVEYDHEKTFLPDGETEQYFILIRDEKTLEWTIWDNTTSGDPFSGGDSNN